MIPFLAVAAMVLANSFYVAAEFSSVSARRARIADLAAGGNPVAAALLPILRDPARLDSYVAACQIGITASSLVLGFYGQRVMAARLAAVLQGQEWLSEVAAGGLAVAAVLVGLTALQIILGELVPKAIAIRHPERLALWTSYPMRLSVRLFSPFIWLFNGSGGLLLRLLGLGGSPRHTHLHSPSEIERLITESGAAGFLDAEAHRMLHNAFDLSGLVARQVMIPRNRLVLADVETTLDALLTQVAQSPFSRIPVYRGTPDAIIGIVHLKDVFRASVEGHTAVANLVRSVPVVPETLPVGRLWQLLNQQQTYLAIVLDEHGGTAGIATLEDLLEEIIGEVQDEFDVETARIVRRTGSPPLVRGDLLVADVNEALGLDLPTDRADTIGGLVVDELGRLAEPGDEVEILGVQMQVETVRRHSIERLAVFPLRAASSR